MSRISVGAMLACALLGLAMATPADAAKKKKAPAAKATATATTNIDDCAKLDPSKRDACISQSRPVKGADLYAKYAGGAAPAAAAAKPAAVAPAKAAKPAAVATKGAAPAIEDCAKLDAAKRDACISSSRPTSGADLYKKYSK